MSTSEIDHSSLKRLLDVLGNDTAELQDLLQDYIEDAPDLARRITEAAAQGDRTALRIAAHTLKSNARDFGATRLAELCAGLEKACVEGRPEDPEGYADRIRQAEQAARLALLDVSLDDLDGPGSVA
ncbi:Hpt domain-containing protein [Seohaeicola saemankumensis]|uniref:Hpt domain-containing protein n=1 Tax=Seohaeicola saemankumensis TaxID=481181 RepID=A0ABW3TH38_9RHOB